MMNRFTQLHRVMALTALLAASSLAAQAQGVGVGTTAPDASAALDIVSSSKGALLPRLTSAQRGAIASPARGLLVFQTDAPTGFYYNASTSTAPNWQQVATAAGAAVTATNGLTQTGSAFGLGGTLSTATTIAQAGNAFSLTGGNVGIGTATPTQTLDVNGGILARGYGSITTGGAYLAWNRSGYEGETWIINQPAVGNYQQHGIRFGESDQNNNIIEWARFGPTGGIAIGGINTTSYKLDVTGTIRATGAVTASAYNAVSDRRFKTQVRPLTNALTAIQALRGVRYQWNTLGVQRGGTAGAEQVGFIAQELEAVYPELVSTGPDGYKAVNYAQLTPVLLEAIKEQQTQIEALRAQNAIFREQAVQTTADHASLLSLQAQLAHLLGNPAPATTRR